MELEYATDEEGHRCYYVKAHVTDEEFRAALRWHVYEDDPILDVPPTRTWKRMCRDVGERCTMIIDAAKASRGAFPVTWVEDAEKEGA